MKKFIFALTALTVASSSFAATTGTLLLKGQVGEVLSILVTPETIAATLPLHTSQVDTKVATVNEQSNTSDGYKVTVSSENLGYLKRTGGTELFEYHLKYNDELLDLSAPHEIPYSSVGLVNENRDVTISYTGVPAVNMVAGVYEDTLLFEISSN